MTEKNDGPIGLWVLRVKEGGKIIGAALKTCEIAGIASASSSGFKPRDVEWTPEVWMREPGDEAFADVVDFIRRTPFVERSDEIRLAQLQAAEAPRSRAVLAARWLEALARRDPKSLGEPVDVVEARIRVSFRDIDAGVVPDLDDSLIELAGCLGDRATDETIAGILADIAALAIIAGSGGR